MGQRRELPRWFSAEPFQLHTLSIGGHHQGCLGELAGSRGEVKCVSPHFYGGLQDLRSPLAAKSVTLVLSPLKNLVSVKCSFWGFGHTSTLSGLNLTVPQFCSSYPTKYFPRAGSQPSAKLVQVSCSCVVPLFRCKSNVSYKFWLTKSVSVISPRDRQLPCSIFSG